jgi:hypothetical protein
MEDAVRLSRKGLKACLICRSDPLAAHIRERLAKVEAAVGVWSISELCRDLADQTRISYPVSAGIEAGIECLISAIRVDSTLGFDAIIVDEAQDFRTHWWIAIEELLSKGGSPCLHAYFDTNQSIYGDLAGELAAFRIVPVHLTRNLRNTRCIHDAATKFYRGIPITADGPEGMNVDWQECPEQKINARVVSVAAHLIGEKVAPTDIVILAVDARSKADIRNRSGFPSGVEVSLIEDFKGLERKAVIIAASRGLADQSELAYVSLSRPRAHLAVVGEKDILFWLGMPAGVPISQA